MAVVYDKLTMSPSQRFVAFLIEREEMGREEQEIATVCIQRMYRDHLAHVKLQNINNSTSAMIISERTKVFSRSFIVLYCQDALRRLIRTKRSNAIVSSDFTGEFEKISSQLRTVEQNVEDNMKAMMSTIIQLKTQIEALNLNIAASVLPLTAPNNDST